MVLLRFGGLEHLEAEHQRAEEHELAVTHAGAPGQKPDAARLVDVQVRTVVAGEGSVAVMGGISGLRDEGLMPNQHPEGK